MRHEIDSDNKSRVTTVTTTVTITEHDDSTPAKKPRHSESKETNRGNWQCTIRKEFSYRAPGDEGETKNEKSRKTTKLQCKICKKKLYRGNLKKHMQMVHSKERNRVECDQCEKTYTLKQNLVRHMKKKHPVNQVAAVTKKTELLKDNEKISCVIKVTEYECACGKTEYTYDASVRHAQEHLVEWDALIRENGTQSELKFDYQNRANINKRSLIKTKFYFKTLFGNSWIKTFEPTKWSSIILASSLYKYTRRVKLNWGSEKKDAVPLYKCSACELFIEPSKVETHCDSYPACVICVHRGHKCSECQIHFNSPNALMLHNTDHDTDKNPQFRIVTFNNQNDEQFNQALKRMLHLFEQKKISESLGTPERNVLEKNDVQNNEETRVLKFCAQCNRSYFDTEDHNAYHENKSKSIIEAIAREQNSCSSETAEVEKKKKNGNTEEEAEPEENVSNNGIIKRDSDKRRGNVQAYQQNDNSMAVDGSAVVEWNSDGDSEDDDQQSFNTLNLQAQLNLIPKHFGRIFTKKDEMKQRTSNDCRKFQSNGTKKDNAVKGGIGPPDPYDQCELTLGRIFGEGNNGVDTLESNNESQSTEELQRMLEGDAESVLRGDE